MTQRFYVTASRIEARSILDHLLTAGSIYESVTDTLEEAINEAVKADSHCVIIVEKDAK